MSASLHAGNYVTSGEHCEGEIPPFPAFYLPSSDGIRYTLSEKCWVTICCILSCRTTVGEIERDGVLKFYYDLLCRLLLFKQTNWTSVPFLLVACVPFTGLSAGFNGFTWHNWVFCKALSKEGQILLIRIKAFGWHLLGKCLFLLYSGHGEFLCNMQTGKLKHRRPKVANLSSAICGS